MNTVEETEAPEKTGMGLIDIILPLYEVSFK
jgi:hypothetical protein